MAGRGALTGGGQARDACIRRPPKRPHGLAVRACPHTEPTACHVRAGWSLRAAASAEVEGPYCRLRWPYVHAQLSVCGDGHQHDSAGCMQRVQGHAWRVDSREQRVLRAHVSLDEAQLVEASVIGARWIWSASCQRGPSRSKSMHHMCRGDRAAQHSELSVSLVHLRCEGHVVKSVASIGYCAELARRRERPAAPVPDVFETSATKGKLIRLERRRADKHCQRRGRLLERTRLSKAENVGRLQCRF